MCLRKPANTNLIQTKTATPYKYVNYHLLLTETCPCFFFLHERYQYILFNIFFLTLVNIHKLGYLTPNILFHVFIGTSQSKSTGNGHPHTDSYILEALLSFIIASTIYFYVKSGKFIYTLQEEGTSFITNIFNFTHYLKSSSIFFLYVTAFTHGIVPF